MKIRQDRVEYGQTFKWCPRSGFWRSTSGKREVHVVPPKRGRSWRVVVPSLQKSQDLTGENAEARAFSVAEGYTRQP